MLNLSVHEYIAVNRIWNFLLLNPQKMINMVALTHHNIQAVMHKFSNIKRLSHIKTLITYGMTISYLFFLMDGGRLEKHVSGTNIDVQELPLQL